MLSFPREEGQVYSGWLSSWWPTWLSGSLASLCADVRSCHTCETWPTATWLDVVLPTLLLYLTLFGMPSYFLPRDHLPTTLSSDKQHLSYDVCLEVRGEIIRTVLFCIVYWSCAQSQGHLNVQFSQFSGLGFVTLGPYVSVWARWGGPDGIEA